MMVLFTDMSRAAQMLAQVLLLTGFLAWLTNHVSAELFPHTRDSGVEIKQVEPVCVCGTCFLQEDGVCVVCVRTHTHTHTHEDGSAR